MKKKESKALEEKVETHTFLTHNNFSQSLKNIKVFGHNLILCFPCLWCETQYCDYNPVILSHIDFRHWNRLALLATDLDLQIYLSVKNFWSTQTNIHCILMP